MQTKAEVAAYVLSVARAYPALGISGPRRYDPNDKHEAVIRWLIENCLEQIIVTGCAKGADAIARESRNGATVHDVADYKQPDIPYVAALAKRSIGCINDVKANAGIWCAFPNTPCPPKVRPKPSWCSGGGSGTWASLAYAVGHGLPCLVWAGNTEMPEWLHEVGWGWHLAINPKDGATKREEQLALI